MITGGVPLRGTVRISGAKNAALPIIISSLLADGISTYSNVPKLRDIDTVLLLLEHLGAKCYMEDNQVTIDTRGLCSYEAPYDLVRKMRASILVLCPLVARMKRAKVSLPGGCAIGARPVNLHIRGLHQLGAEVEIKHGFIEAKAERLKGGEIFFDIPTVTGTENIMMAAALSQGTTVIRNAAREPEIIALADTLNLMGGNVSGAGSSMITIEGVQALQPVSAEIIPDRIETGTFLAAAALTKGDITVTHCNPAHLPAVIHKLRLTGADIQLDSHTIRVRGPETITSVDVKTLPYPGFPTDMQAQFMVLMSVASGFCIISETVFENRFIHVSELKRLGADIAVSGNSAMIKGVPQLFGAPVMATDLRASASLILAGLTADGTTEINRVYHLDRGYEAIEKKFSKLGAIIERISE